MDTHSNGQSYQPELLMSLWVLNCSPGVKKRSKWVQKGSPNRICCKSFCQ